MPADPVLLITGASSGIGAATARRAAADGHRLVLAARREDKLAGLVDELGGADRALAVACDVTVEDDQHRVVARALEHFGRLDAVFANAGHGGTAGFRDGSPDEWRSMLLTNVLGAALTVRAAMDALVASSGHLVLTGSVAGRIVVPGSVYSASKHAVTALAEAARLELHGTGVRVTVLQPGYTASPFWESELSLEPLAVDDVADAVLYALSRPPHVAVNELVVRPTAQRP